MSEPKKLRCRFGLRLKLPLLKNAGVFVVYMTHASVSRMSEAVETVRDLLIISGREDIARMIVFEQGP